MGVTLAHLEEIRSRAGTLSKECVKMLTLPMAQSSPLLELRMDLDVLENTVEIWPLDQKSQLEPVPILEMFAEQKELETKENVSGNSKSNLVKMILLEPQEFLQPQESLQPQEWLEPQESHPMMTHAGTTTWN